MDYFHMDLDSCTFCTKTLGDDLHFHAMNVVAINPTTCFVFIKMVVGGCGYALCNMVSNITSTSTYLIYC